VLLGAAVGVVNGLLVARARVDAFIATLGTLTVVQAW
jgi:ribose transport system permease protein